MPHLPPHRARCTWRHPLRLLLALAVLAPLAWGLLWLFALAGRGLIALLMGPVS